MNEGGGRNANLQMFEKPLEHILGFWNKSSDLEQIFGFWTKSLVPKDFDPKPRDFVQYTNICPKPEDFVPVPEY